MDLYTRAMSACALDSRGPPLVMPDEPMKARIRPAGMPYYEKDRNSSEIARVFQWDVVEDNLLPLDTPARRRIRRKNFISLNKEEVKRIEDRVKNMQKKTKEQVKQELTIPLWKSDKPNHVRNRVNKDNPQSSNATTNGPKGNNAVRRPESSGPSGEGHHGAGRNVQNGIRPASKNDSGREAQSRRSKSIEPLRLDDKEENMKKKKNPSERKHEEKSKEKSAANRFNAQVPNQRASSVDRLIGLNEGKNKLDAALKNHPRGQVPKYIKEQKMHQRDNEPPINPKPPPGHVLMDSDEKDKTLASLKRAESDLLKRFNSLPVRTDTDCLKRRKQQLLRQLEEVDEAIKIFSRPKVYIKTDPF